MSQLKVAVIGVGYLGKFHADKYAMLDNIELIAVCDNNPDTAKQIADKHQVEAHTDYRPLLERVDAVSIATPTQYHYEICKDFLQAGKHVLVEKPITTTIEQAKELTTLAAKQGVVFQVGHLERFNVALLSIKDKLNNPQFIESQRLAPFNPRGTDVNVILDLMIHDIDLIQSIVNSPIIDIDAQGTPVLTQFVDIANVRLKFASGCVANVTASRVSFKGERKMRIFQEDSYISVDFGEQTYALFHKGDGEMYPGIANIEKQVQKLEKGDSLLLQIESFIDAIINNKQPVVGGQQGTHALETASHITQLIRQQLVQRSPERFGHLADNLNFDTVVSND